MPRWIEVCLAFGGLVLLAPLLALISLAVRLSGPGPILFRQDRVGRAGRLFQILKFRTMVTDAEARGLKITCGGHDPRVTAVGFWLRKFKLDELPQLVNVLAGDMKFVGPRPEVPEYVRLWDANDREVLLAVPPGITDPASLAFVNEDEELGREEDPERAYVERVMPAKLAMNLEYLESRNAVKDFGLIATTVKRAVLRV